MSFCSDFLFLIFVVFVCFICFPYKKKWLLFYVGYLHTKEWGWSMNFPICDFNVSPSRRTLAPTNYPQNFHPHEPCLCCSSPYHSSGNCSHWGQFFNFSYGQMNTNFPSQGFESHSNSYTLNWNNHSDLLWSACATGNYALQFDELHHLEYL